MIGLLAGCLVPPPSKTEDIILGRLPIPHGGSDKMGWSVGFQWMGDPEEIRDDIVNGGFDRNVNAAGGFSLVMPLDDFALNLLGDTVVRIYYDGEPQFWGYIAETDIDEATNQVNVSGGDMMQRLALQKVSYKGATAGGANPPIGDVGSKDVFEELIHWYTGETAADSMFTKEFIEYSETSYRYNYDGNTLLDALIDVAQSSSLTVGDQKHIGYGFWIDGNEYIYCQPYGWRSYDKEIPGYWKLKLDYGPIRNRVHLRGGIPEAFDIVQDTEENYSYDLFEASPMNDWDVTVSNATVSESGSNPTADTTDVKMGGYSAKLTNCSLTGSGGDSYIYVTNTFTNAKDWSYTDESGNQQSTVDTIRMWYTMTRSSGVYVILYIEIISDTGGYIAQCQVDQVPNDKVSWTKVSRTLENFDSDTISTNDEWDEIKKLRVTWWTDEYNAWGGDIWNDGLAVFFKEVDIWRRDETSIRTHGLKEAKFQDRRITDWKTAETIAENILELLKNPAVNADTTIPYYDPDLKLNMLVEPEVKGVKWPLYVNGLSVSWSGDHVSTIIKAGRPVPTEDDILMTMHILRDQDSEKGTGFQMASTYEESSCFKDKELYCRTDCQVSNCQNAAQLLACYTFAERNPCLTSCQKYKERTGWLNRILE